MAKTFAKRFATPFAQPFAKPFVIALLGAESTGKTTLGIALQGALQNSFGMTNQHVSLIPEHLRQWCEQHQRTPHQAEQAAIAQKQSQHIAAAAASNIVIADTTALMTAVYSDQVFGDKTLYESALAQHQDCIDLTLLMGLDLPWVADGLQRDGPQVRSAVDGLLRCALQRSSIPFTTVYGLGLGRTDAALQAILRAMNMRDTGAAPKTWKHWCECCGDGECEKKLSQLLDKTMLPRSLLPQIKSKR